VSIYAASVDTGENASEVAADLSYPLGQGVSREIADSLGAWWEDRRGIIQPTQFLMRRDGSIIQSTYSDGPLGRLDAPDVCGLVNFLISQK
jgi:peroxiredoxin